MILPRQLLLLSLVSVFAILPGACATTDYQFHGVRSAMHERENLDAVKDIYAGFAAGDLDVILGKMDDDVVWEHPGSRSEIPFAGRFEGKAGVLRFFEIAMQSIDVLDQQVNGYLVNANVVAALGHERMRVKASGREYQSNWVHLYTFVAGKIVRFEEFIDTAELRRAFAAGQ